MNIQGIKSGLSTEVDIVPVAITPPTAARIHGIASASTEDSKVAVKQVETATVVGTITGSGNATVIVTSTGMTGSPKSISVAVLENDTAAAVATKIAAALTSDSAVGHVSTGKFVVTSDANKVILTAKVAAANDSALNVNINNGTCTGLTAAATSANTTAGSAASGSGKIVVEGIDINDKDVSEVVYLTGTTSVNTVNSYKFINSMYSYNTNVNVGVITATAAVDSTVSCTISAGAGESQQAYYMPHVDKVVKSIQLSTANSTAGAITTFKIKVKTAFGAWRTKQIIYLINSDVLPSYPLNIEVPKKALLKVTATASGGTSTVGANLVIE